MKLIPTIARYLLGLIFVVFGLNFWFQFLTVPSPPGSSEPFTCRVSSPW